MIEMLGVLAIIGVLSAGGIWAYNVAMEQYKINKTINDIELITANTLSVYSKPPKSGEAIIQPYDMQKIGILPSNYKTSRSSDGLKSLFNTNMTVAIRNDEFGKVIKYPTYSINTQQFIRIRLNLNDKSTCVKFLTHDWRKLNAVLTMSCVVQNKSSCTTYFDDAPPSFAKAEEVCTPHTSANTYIFILYIFTHGQKSKL